MSCEKWINSLHFIFLFFSSDSIWSGFEIWELRWKMYGIWKITLYKLLATINLFFCTLTISLLVLLLLLLARGFATRPVIESCHTTKHLTSYCGFFHYITKSIKSAIKNRVSLIGARTEPVFCLPWLWSLISLKYSYLKARQEESRKRCCSFYFFLLLFNFYLFFVNFKSKI